LIINKKRKIIMNKNISVGILAAVLVIAGVAGFSINKKNNDDKDAKAAEVITIEKSKAAVSVSPEVIVKTDASPSPEAMMAKHGNYVTLADFDKDPSVYTDSKKVYFFHASWCSICQSIDKAISADMSTIPVDVTLIKTDFDSSAELRKKYSVTTQYTFVQVDNSGNMTSKWSATDIDKAIAKVQ
jgi:thioredoxin 1